MGKIKLSRFADGEINTQVLESVRGNNIYLIQSTSTPVNDHLMELLLMIDAIKRASAAQVNAIIPYYGYARQDRKTKPRVPISASLVARLIEEAGVNRVISVDLHCGQIQGFFKAPVDNLYPWSFFINEIFKENEYSDVCIVSPDAGGVERCGHFKNELEKQYPDIKISLAMMNKKRTKANEIESMELVGEIKDKDCILVDDMIDTGGTLVLASEILKKHGAKKILACCTHGLLNGNATQKIDKSPIEKLYVTDTIHIPNEKLLGKINVISISKLIAESIRRIQNCESISALFP